MYKTLKPVYVKGTWYPAGAEIPADVTEFDYVKAARKGMIEAPEGEEVRNVGEEPPSSAVTADTSAEQQVLQIRSEMEKQVAEAREAAQAAEAKLEQANAEAAKLQAAAEASAAQIKELEAELTAAKKAVADGKLIPDDLQARLESVSGIGEELAKKAVVAITAKKSPAKD